MGFLCFKCRIIIPGPVRKLISHLHMAHALFDMKDLKLVCGQGGCPSSFSTFNSFRKHVKNQHPQDEAEADLHGPVRNDIRNDMDGDIDDFAQNMEHDVDEDVRLLHTTKQSAIFIGSLLSDANMTHATMSRVISATTTLNHEIVEHLKSKVISTLDRIGVEQGNEDYQQLLADFDNEKSLFKGLNTRYKQETFLNAHLGVVQPTTIFLGFRYDVRTDRQNGQAKQVVVSETFQYVSVLATLGMVLGDGYASNEIEVGHVSHDNVLRDFCDGRQCKTHPLFSTNNMAIQICLYFDEFEVVNPLGSKRGIHKVGAFYYTLKNLHPRLNSSLDNIHLLAFCNCLDLKKYGFDFVLAPFVTELKKLESVEGAEIVLPDNSIKTVRGTLSQVCGDNLGVNGLLGFVESFGANKPCRICSGHKDQFQTLFLGEDFPLRDKDTHTLHVEECVRNAAAAVTLNGVKRDCILNSLSYFHVTQNTAPDIMHDLLEGVIPMEVKLVLYRFIYDDNLFTLHKFNALMLGHNYGHCDLKNKPSLISESTLKGKDNSLKQHACQMWCLFRVLPLLIGSLIPEDNLHWKLILKLRTIVDIAFADAVTDSLSLYLKYVIQDHHTLFQQLFPTIKLIPKHHFLVHYPMAMRAIGPLINVWCMRFEAKHNMTKRMANVVCCFKDICLTAASRHQISHCCRWSQHDRGGFETGEVISYSVKDVENYPALLNKVPGLLPEDDVFVTQKVTYHGTDYRTGTIVAVTMANEMPHFGQISYVIIVGRTIFLTGSVWKAEYFDEHIHCYIVKESNTRFFLQPDMLVNFRPLHLNKHGDRDAVSPRNYIF